MPKMTVHTQVVSSTKRPRIMELALNSTASLPSSSLRSRSPPPPLPAATSSPAPQSVPCAWRRTPAPRLPLSDLPASACSAALCYDEPTKIKECTGSGRHQMSLYDIRFLIFGIKKEIVRSQLLRKGKVDRRLVLFQPDTLQLYFGSKSE